MQCTVWIVECNTGGQDKNLVGYIFSLGKKWGGGSGNGRDGCSYSDSEKDSWSWVDKKTQWIWHTEYVVENRRIMETLTNSLMYMTKILGGENHVLCGLGLWPMAYSKDDLKNSHQPHLAKRFKYVH